MRKTELYAECDRIAAAWAPHLPYSEDRIAAAMKVFIKAGASLAAAKRVVSDAVRFQQADPVAFAQQIVDAAERSK